MKKGKILTVIVILLQLILVSSSITASYIEPDNKQIDRSNNGIIEVFQEFSMPEVKENNNFVNIHLDEVNSFISNTGEPVLPIYMETLEFPLGTNIKDIECIVTDMEEINLQKKIIPASKPVPWYNENDVIQIEKNEEIYSRDQLYPNSFYSYKLAGGLNRKNEHTAFLTIQLNPVRYNPIKDNIQFVKSIKLEISYEEPSEPLLFDDEYDLLIISYDRFARLLEPLVTHKESHNIRTKLVTLEDIYHSVYFPVHGRDCAEEIKYFIKDAIEKWNVTYAMLVGNFKKMPVRYASLESDKGGFYEELKFLSDLYYADIYDSEGNFSSWDSDEDLIFGEWPDNSFRQDDVDLSPDVHVGRLACMFGFEVRSLVNKIIDYEENAYGSDWFNKMVVIGGDTFEKSWEDGTDYNEGEEANKKAIEFMTGFEPTKLWTSIGNLNAQNMHNEISNGAGFLYMVGHGNPRNWATHTNGDYENWTEPYRNKNIMQLTNKGMYPILMVGGCHNSEFDVTPINLLIDYEHSRIWTTWILECWSWVFVKNFRGGAIASMGSSGFGGVNIGDHNDNDIPDCVEGADGWFETQFFRLYNEENIDVLGETYSQTVTDYVNNFPVYTDRYDCKIVETHILFGDPSLKIGGYP